MDKPKVIKKETIDKSKMQKRRAALTLLWLLIKENPDDAKRFVERLKTA
jgi:hypothetical protein